MMPQPPEPEQQPAAKRRKSSAAALSLNDELEPVAATAPPNGFFDFNIHLLKWTQLVQDQLERIPQIRVELGTVGG